MIDPVDVTGSRGVFIAHLQRVAASVPAAVVEQVACALDGLAPGPFDASCGALASGLAQPTHRTTVQSLLEAWRLHAPDLLPATVAFALRTAVACHAAAREAQEIELVWTGPEVEGAHRRTEQALLQVIEEAVSRLTVVSFVAYKVPAVRDALERAAGRGVSVRLVIEDAEVSEGKVVFDALAALRPELAAHSQVFVWPLDRRRRDANGRHGSLHAKCAVADAHSLLVSSANLTEHAFTLNMELGILIHGGPLPARVARYFDSLIQSGTLMEVAG